MPRITAIVRCVLSVSLAAACAQSGGGSTPRLADTDWLLVDLGGEPARTAGDIPQPNLRLVSAEQRARGSGGCNSFSGPYEATQDALRFGPLATTRRACLDAAMTQQEVVYLQALTDTRRWHLAGDTLVLGGAAGPLARLVAVPPGAER